MEDINAHAIRRGYAKKLLDTGANIVLISKALGHSDLGVTTQYLDLDTEDVATSLSDYLWYLTMIFQKDEAILDNLKRI